MYRWRKQIIHISQKKGLFWKILSEILWIPFRMEAFFIERKLR